MEVRARLKSKILLVFVIAFLFGDFVSASSSVASTFTRCGATVAYLAHTPPDRRIVVVGMGAVSSLGATAVENYERAVAGHSGIGRLELPPHYRPHIPVRVAGAIPNFEVGRLPSGIKPSSMARTHLLGLYSSVAAMVDAKLLDTVDSRNWVRHYHPEDLGVFIGSTHGDISALELATEQFLTAVRDGTDAERAVIDKQFALKGIPSLAAGHTSIVLGAEGPIGCPSAACASGTQALGFARNELLLGQAEIILAGGADSQLTPMGLYGRHLLGALTRHAEPETASRPFNENRDGFVMGEGAAVLALTTEKFARERGLNILAYVGGVGLSSDAVRVTDPWPKTQARAIQKAIEQAGLTPDQIGFIHAHATGTAKGDNSELAALKLVYGDHFFRIPIGATKSNTGHTMGASGALAAVIAIQAMNRGVVPQILNLDNPGPAGAATYGLTTADFREFNFVRGTAMPVDIEAVIVDSFGFAGQNAAAVFVRPLRN